MSLVNSHYELIDPNPDLHASFLQFNECFFYGRLASVEVGWSKKMTRCAGICSFRPRLGHCIIRLSEPLLKFRPRKDFVETLLHEMIHAFLFLTSKMQDRDGHGPRFQAHMVRINNVAGTNITIYHSFHAEVAQYLQHVWRCNGPCRHRGPYFGYVKRATNRAPSKNDTWWARHSLSCGGLFVKISEPEGYGKKKRGADISGSSSQTSAAKKKPPALPAPPPTISTIDSFFGKPEVPKPTTTFGFPSPKKNPLSSPSKRFPGTGHRLGDAKSSAGTAPTAGRSPRPPVERPIDSFFGKPSNTGASAIWKKEPPICPGNDRSGSRMEIPATPSHGTSSVMAPPLIKREVDDFTWDDDDVIGVDGDDDVIILDGNDCGPRPGLTLPKPIPVSVDVEVIEVVDRRPKNDSNSVKCPACWNRVPLIDINRHLDTCAK